MKLSTKDSKKLQTQTLIALNLHKNCYSNRKSIKEKEPDELFKINFRSAPTMR